MGPSHKTGPIVNVHINSFVVMSAQLLPPIYVCCYVIYKEKVKADSKPTTPIVIK